MGQSELSRRVHRKLRRVDEDRSIINKVIKGKRELSGLEMLAVEEITGFPAPTRSSERITLVPLISWVSAGSLADASTQVPVEDVPLLAFADLGRGNFFALRVEGDSMNRVSPDQSVIIVNRHDRELHPDRFYVFAVRGETTYKRWHASPPYLAPCSTNPMHEPIFLNRSKDAEVIGRVRRSVLDL